MPKFATNDTAKTYQRLEAELDWCTASDQEQIDQMNTMRSALSKVLGSTVIIDWEFTDPRTGTKVVVTASEKLEILDRRVARFERLKRKVA
ncbi:hypothetical protein [Reinekea sp. G2M2-21]|uniref:hypothetical protein n=1 Tax=Reinekea sp. G2M2-21 TaxID=2788942 RepID=UPI0018AAB3A6|nr:hypothetical protein [Reinekea sp. G2M2-21]